MFAQNGDWEAWLDFFLEVLKTTVLAVVAMAIGCRSYFAAMKRSSWSGLIRPKQHKQLNGLSFPKTGKASEVLVNLGVAREITRSSRNRLFTDHAYLAILNEGTKPL